MKKAAIQFVVLAALFAALFAGLLQVDWMRIFRVSDAVRTTEEKLGDLIWEFMHRTEHEVHSKVITQGVDSLVAHLCKANDIDLSSIKVHILEKDEINAMTLPDRYLVIYTGLLSEAENQEELLGVLGHEIAHMQKNHVMKKLVKEVGLAALVSMTTGKNGGQAAQELASTLSSTAYDRTLEREADLSSVDFMIKAGVNPEPFADFLYRLGDEDIPNAVFWVSTHPESKERAENIIAYIKGKKIEKKQVLSENQWQRFKAKLGDLAP